MSVLTPTLELLPVEIRYYIRCEEAHISSLQFQAYLDSESDREYLIILEELRRTIDEYIEEKQDLGLDGVYDLTSMYMARARINKIIQLLVRGKKVDISKEPVSKPVRVKTTSRKSDMDRRARLQRRKARSKSFREDDSDEDVEMLRAGRRRDVERHEGVEE